MFDARDFGGELLAEKSVEERRGDRDGQDTQRTLSVPGLCDLPGRTARQKWSNEEDSYESTAVVHSTVAGETYDFMAKIPATKLTGRKVRFMIEVTTQHRLYVSSDFEEYVVPGPIEPDPDQPGDSGESDGSENSGV